MKLARIWQSIQVSEAHDIPRRRPSAPTGVQCVHAQRRACPDRTRAIPCTVQVVTDGSARRIGLDSRDALAGCRRQRGKRYLRNQRVRIQESQGMSSGRARKSATKARRKKANTVTMATEGLTVTVRLHVELDRPHPVHQQSEATGVTVASTRHL